MSTTSPVIPLLVDPDRRDIPPTIPGFLTWLGGPTAIRISGRDGSRCRALATLLHGNEPSGFEALHQWLRSGAVPAVDMLFFVGAIDAALAPPGFAHRMLPGRRDLNRCFRPPHDDREGRIAEALLALLDEHQPEALVDVHNNTGQNPPYGFLTEVDTARLTLVSMYADACVISDLSLGTLIEATSSRFPSVTIECGRAGDPNATDVALAGLNHYAGGDQLRPHPVNADTMVVFQHPIQVRLRPEIDIAFGEEPRPDADLTFAPDLDRHNFRRLPPGMPLAWVGTKGIWPLDARGGDAEEVSSHYFEIRDGRLRVRKELVPIMITTNERVAKDDCLCYLVERHILGAASRGM